MFQILLQNQFYWNWHYGGEMMMWLGLNLSALVSFPLIPRFYSFLAAGPLCYAIPCLFFLENDVLPIVFYKQ